MSEPSTNEPNRSSPETASRVYDHVRTSPALGAAARAADLGISTSQIARSLRQLLAEGCLEVARKGTGPGYPTVYRVTGREHVNPYAVP